MAVATPEFGSVVRGLSKGALEVVRVCVPNMLQIHANAKKIIQKKKYAPADTSFRHIIIRFALTVYKYATQLAKCKNTRQQ